MPVEKKPNIEAAADVIEDFLAVAAGVDCDDDTRDAVRKCVRDVLKAAYGKAKDG